MPGLQVLAAFVFAGLLGAHRAACLCWGREPGCRPGGRGTFLCFAKEKYPKERRPPVCDPFAVRRGKPASSRLRDAPWNSLRCVAASFRHPRRVSSRGMGAPTPMLTPQPPRRRRSQQGWTTEHPNNRTAGHPFGPLLRSASFCGRKRHALRKLGRAQRWPVWMFCPLCPSGCAEERRVWRIRARVCLSDAQRRELSETPPNLSTAGCPVAKRRGRRQWGRPFFGSFLSATRKKGTRLPGDSRPPPSKKASHSMRANPQT